MIGILTHQRLHEAIAAVAPIISVSRVGNSATITFDPAATAPQQTSANAVLAGFDFSDAATTTWLTAKEPLLTDLQDQAAAGIAAIDTYLTGADAATAAQVRSEVKAIDQRQKKIIQALNRITHLAWR